MYCQGLGSAIANTSGVPTAKGSGLVRQRARKHGDDGADDGKRVGPDRSKLVRRYRYQDLHGVGWRHDGNDHVGRCIDRPASP